MRRHRSILFTTLLLAGTFAPIGCASSPDPSGDSPPAEAPAPSSDRDDDEEEAGADARAEGRASADEPADEEAVDPATLPPPLRAALRVDSVVVRPDRIALEMGATFDLRRLEVEALDSAGRRVEGVPIQTFMQSRVATVSEDTLESGMVERVIRPHSPGEATLVVALPGSVSREGGELRVDPRILHVPVEVVAGAVERVEVDVPREAVFAGTSVRLEARAFAGGGVERPEPEVAWSAVPETVATVDGAGVLRARGAGTVRVTARAGDVEDSATVEVVDNPVHSLEISPARAEVRTGDVVRFSVRALDAGERPVEDAPVVYTVTAGDASRRAGAAVYDDGAFVAEEPGTYRVVASVGGVANEAVVVAERRDEELRAERIGLGLQSEHPTSDLWVFRGRDGRDYAYVGTHLGGQTMYAWDVTDPSNPVLTDSVVVDARVVNDVKVNDDASIAVITREGASNRRNGIVLLDLADPAHPTVLSEYTETVTGGVHNTYIVDDLVYAIHDGTLDVHIIDIGDPMNPREVGRWGIDRPGKYLHDVWVEDGLAYVSYWDDGVYILDVGDGRWGGTPTDPTVVGSHEYRTQWGEEEYGNTHVAFPYTNGDGNRYLFVGDEIFDCEACVSRHYPGGDGPRGHVHVLDITDPENPEEVAFYRVPEAGAHNLWAEDDKLYVAYYEGGLRVLDISGELRGDLYAQGREMAWYPTGTEDGHIPNSPMAWGPQPYRGNVFVSDHHSGLWIIRLTPEDRGEVLP
ncbi:MAG: hypothetical protein ACODAE_11100 [Gemmatimonadota bacterium]